MCGSGISIYNDSCRGQSDASSVESPELAKAVEAMKKNCAVAGQKLLDRARQKDSQLHDRIWKGDAQKQAAGSLNTSKVKEYGKTMVQLGVVKCPSSRLSTRPDCWDTLCCGEAGMLGTLHSSAQSLAFDCGITDDWCCSLFEELLDEDWKDSDDEIEKQIDSSMIA